MYENILHKPLRLRTNISASARNILEGVSTLCSIGQIKDDFKSVLKRLRRRLVVRAVNSREFVHVLFCFM